MTSTHKVEVVPVVLEKHPNADSLSIVRVFGYTCIVRTQDWEGKTRGAYIPPDSIVPDTPDFSFLGGKRRIKVSRLRGILSQGLLWPVDEATPLGEDVAEKLGVTHYERPMDISKVTYGEEEKGPMGIPTYDLESWYRYPDVFQGREIIITEKIHGASAKYLFLEGRMWAGSRRTWKKEAADNMWWRILRENTWIEGWCRTHPGCTLFGEIYGYVQDLRYGHLPGTFSFRAFDVMESDGRWKGGYEFHYNQERGLVRVPILYIGMYSEEILRSHIDGPTLLGGEHLREGAVIRTMTEEWSPLVGRLHLKAVSAEYLSR